MLRDGGRSSHAEDESGGGRRFSGVHSHSMRVNPDQLKIIHHPAPVLRAKALPVQEITDEIRAVADTMLRLMKDAPGIGLAAPQVGLSWRLFVCDVPSDEDDRDPPHPTPPPDTPPGWSEGPIIAINPTLSEPSRDLLAYEEGCLSLPNITGDVRRPSEITLTALDEQGNQFSMRASGLLARCWQHEYDHLDGVLILDRMTAGARLKNRRAVKELERGIA